VVDREEPVLVTTAARSPREERQERERRYLITMAIRVVAFVVAIVVARGWVRVIAVALALVLPWIAVVAANAPRRSRSAVPVLYSKRAPRQITDRAADRDADRSMSA
jgi:Flp pilus assembly protein TadB